MNKSTIVSRTEVQFSDDSFDEDYSLIIEVCPDNRDWTNISYRDAGKPIKELVSFPNSELGNVIMALEMHACHLAGLNRL